VFFKEILPALRHCNFGLSIEENILSAVEKLGTSSHSEADRSPSSESSSAGMSRCKKGKTHQSAKVSSTETTADAMIRGSSETVSFSQTNLFVNPKSRIEAVPGNLTQEDTLFNRGDFVSSTQILEATDSVRDSRYFDVVDSDSSDSEIFEKVPHDLSSLPPTKLKRAHSTAITNTFDIRSDQQKLEIVDSDSSEEDIVNEIEKKVKPQIISFEQALKIITTMESKN
jgi:hypothetical protein